MLNKNFALLVISAGILNIQNQLINPIMLKFSTENGINSGTASYIVGFFAIGSLFLRPLSGLVTEKFHCKQIVIFTSIIMATACFLYGFSISNSVYICVLRFVHGGCFALSGTALMNWVSFYIPKEKMTKGMGIFGAGQIISVATGPFIALLISQNISYFIVFVLASILSLVSASLCLFVKNEVKFCVKNGLFSKKVIKISTFALVLFFINSTESAYIIVFGESLSIGNTWIYFVVTACAMFVARFFISVYLDSKGLSKSILVSFLLLSVAFALLICSAYFGAFLFFISAIFKGIGHGIAQPSLQANTIKSVKKEERALASATFYTACDIGMVLGPFVTASFNQNYILIFAIVGTVSLITALCGSKTINKFS